MNELHFYSSLKSKNFIKEPFSSVCFLGACTAKNLSLGVHYFSHQNIKAYAPYETIFNAPSLLRDLEIVTSNLNHKIIINRQLKLFSDSIRFWNTSSNLSTVISSNIKIDNTLRKAIKNSELVVISLGSVEMWAKSHHVMNRLPKNQFHNPEIQNIYLTSEVIHDIAKDIMKLIYVINPKAKIQFSIPYVLLKASEKYSNLNLATSENYRILKTAIMKLGEQYYFPEYELFKYYIEKGKHNFQDDKRHTSVQLIANVSRHIVQEINKSYLNKPFSTPFSIDKVDNRGRINGKEYL